MMIARAEGQGSERRDRQAGTKSAFIIPTSSLIVLGLVLVALVVRLCDLTGESLWYDEAYSVWISDMDVGSLRVLWEWKVEFPLYYLLFHYWLRLFGQGEFAVRLFAALAGTATVIPVYLLGRELFDHKVGVFAALLLAVNPYHVWYSQEVRMHSLAVLLAVASLYCFWRLMSDPPLGRSNLVWWLGHILVTGLGFHLHYYIIWIVLVENVYCLLHLWRQHRDQGSGARGQDPDPRSPSPVWRSLRLWILDQLAVLLLAIPAAIVFWERFYFARDWGWLLNNRAPGLGDVVGLFEAYTVGTAFPGPSALRKVILLVFLGLAGWGTLKVCWGIWKKKQPGGGLGLTILALVLPIMLVLLVGQLVAIWVPRYMLLFLPAFLLLVALGVRALQASFNPPQIQSKERLKLVWRRPAFCAVALALCLAASLYSLTGMYGSQQKEDWRGVAAYISAQASQEDLIVLLDEECRVPFSYYYGSQGTRVEVSRFANEAALDQAVAEIGRRQRGGSLWLVVSHADGAALEERLEAVAGLQRAESPRFVGIELVRYRWL